MAVFTSKDKRRTFKILKKYKIFSTIISADDVKKENQTQRITQDYQKDESKKDSFFIGDTIFDFKAATAAKINYLHASWGVEKIENKKYYLS